VWIGVLRKLITAALLLLLGIILFAIPAGHTKIETAWFSTSLGGNVHKIFPQFFLAWLAYMAIRKQKIRWGAFAAPLTALAMVTILSAGSSITPYASLGEGVRILLCLGLYIALLNLPWKETRFERVLICFALGIWFMGARVLFLRIAEDQVRVSGYHNHPNILGSLAVLLLVILFLLAESVRRPGGRTFCRVTAAVLGAVVVFTISRSAYLALLIFLTFLALFGDWRMRRNVFPTVVAAAVALVIVRAHASERIGGSPLELAGARPGSRIFIVDITFHDALSGMPLTGWGAGRGYSEVLRAKERTLTDHPPYPHLPHPHNQFLEILTGTGFPGLFAWVWLAMAFFSWVWRSRASLGRNRALCLVALLLSAIPILAFQVHLNRRNILPAVVLILVVAELLPEIRPQASRNALRPASGGLESVR
jgi:O-antigen ligase